VVDNFVGIVVVTSSSSLAAMAADLYTVVLRVTIRNNTNQNTETRRRDRVPVAAATLGGIQ
jgi:hypothetical protein